MSKKLIRSIGICLLLCFTVSSVATATPSSQTSSNILYVKQEVSGLANCTSWADACGLQDALDIAQPNDKIYVAAGTYLPTNQAPSTDPRTATFALETGVAIYGGFPENGGEWVERNWALNLTVLSGDIGSLGYPGDNCFHVVTAVGVDQTAILDGFAISGGNANDSSGEGGGIRISEGSPTLQNLTISNNSAASKGGGIFNSGNPTLTNVTISGNNATYGYGGGLYTRIGAPVLTNVTISGNSAIGGGGVYNFSSDSIMTNTTLSGNIANNFGGGLYNNQSHPLLTNVTITGNTAYLPGGGIYNERNSNPTITNSIIWGNMPIFQIGDNSSITTITYSDIQGGYAGTGNINIDPLLDILANNGGFTHTHALRATSPAIDKGNPESCPLTDQRGYARPFDGDSVPGALCDMGAYEFASFPRPLRLSLYLFGKGSVVPSFPESWFQYGSQVTLTATADPGYTFATWVGFDSHNPLNFTILEDTIVTAYFTRDEYSLSVVPKGSGSVAISPSQPFYFYGSEVTLTPTADPGWTFTGWGGNATVGADNKLIITSNTNITANFTQDEYTLTVVPYGSGSVTLDPQQDTYHYGDVVNLTPIAAPDWEFTSWGGDTLVSPDNKVSIKGNTNIIANFKQATFRLYLPSILK